MMGDRTGTAVREARGGYKADYHPALGSADRPMNFIEAYEDHVWDVYGFLAYRTRSAADAEDLTQETFERALRAWSRFDPDRGEVRTWLLVIARNTYIDSRRRANARPEVVSGPENLDHLVAEPVPPQLGPDSELAAALGRLTRREREAIALRFGGDLKISDVAEVLGISVANAQQILSRALKRLRDLIATPKISS